MTILELAQHFSKQLKIAKAQYLANQEFNITEFDEILKSFENIDLTLFDDDHKKKAFWINVYNGFTNYLTIQRRLKTSMKEEPGFFRNHFILIERYEFSLDDIEHGLLRRNAREHLDASDPRLYFQVDELDYRIHFALNCGARSCPAIAYYSVENINEQLDLAEALFSENEFIVDHKNKSIVCSELFVWYQQDFKNVYLNDSELSAYSFSTTPYDWRIS